MRHIRSLAPAVLLVLALAGCGGDDSGSDDDSEASDTPTSSATVDQTDVETDMETDVETEAETDAGDAGGCFISDEEVAAATGIEATAVDSSQSGTTICSWSSTAGDNVNISVKSETGTFDATVSATEGVIGPSEPLSGVGDEAAIFYGSDLLPQAAVIAQAGDQLVAVIYTAATGDEETMRTAVTELAGTVVDNL